ncbi:unnamed protein product [Symbiodinium sp. CCMP2592]|nr:unnamed protein product [Symbiodinium sp. CCMP2592]
MAQDPDKENRRLMEAMDQRTPPYGGPVEDGGSFYEGASIRDGGSFRGYRSNEEEQHAQE